MGMGLPTVPGASTAQFPSIGSVPSRMFPTGVTGLTSKQIPASDLPAVGNLTPDLPSVPPVPSMPQIPGSFPTRITPPGLGAGIELPSPPTESSQSGMAGFGLNPDQLPIGTQDSSFGESRGSMPPIPELGTRVPPTVPQVNSGMLPAVSSQVLGMPTDITSAVPPSTSITIPCREVIPGPQFNFGMVPQDGLLTSSTATPTGTQRLDDTIIPTNPYAGSVDEIRAAKLQEMEHPPIMPNVDLLVRIDLCKSRCKAIQIYSMRTAINCKAIK